MRWVTDDEEIGPQITALGFSPDDIRWVVMTHLHTDHAGGLSHFPNSEIRARKRTAVGVLRRIRELAHDRPPVYVPSHDPEAASRLVGRQIVGRTPGDR
jgi:glyoxylase-like metal-dependent hydrolase (beta-lactamase superfamily II)